MQSNLTLYIIIYSTIDEYWAEHTCIHVTKQQACIDTHLARHAGYGSTKWVDTQHRKWLPCSQGRALVMPMTLTMLLSAPRMEPSTSGYSSPRYSYSTTPRWPSSFSSSHACAARLASKHICCIILGIRAFCLPFGFAHITLLAKPCPSGHVKYIHRIRGRGNQWARMRAQDWEAQIAAHSRKMTT